MNQIIKETVYGKGTQKQVRFMAELGGMKPEEVLVFQLLHEGKTDLAVQEELGLSKKAYERIENSVRSKLTIAVFDCINYRMNMIKD